MIWIEFTKTKQSLLYNNKEDEIREKKTLKSNKNTE